ncbi:L-threonylcarbamoyladenylate synthase [Ectothiorhodospira mobilis]|uniref:Threonylcarbamoyl-AMP synthase n=1 Tax=Ectothiorhodospira mobilis TaxID=195064 RepID=A0A1I4RM05_ECTMO|nr:Sua5/YciO/YrdC/YwlC family protein [Ectothiorhodospira mobilis]SFM53219.1 L-threonylcarbamoyladenylate synthase [Ectothiorhodospira mobilis]
MTGRGTRRRALRPRAAAAVIRSGGVVAYPTEAVYGLGCAPCNRTAVQRLLRIKGRAQAKGLILVAADPAQLTPFLAPVDPALQDRALATWPGPVTWLWPAAPHTPRWLTGDHDTLAVRVTDHPLAAALCRHAGTALVSTSANRSDAPPCRHAQAVDDTLGHGLDLILAGDTGGRDRPSEIRDLGSGRVLRPGG